MATTAQIRINAAENLGILGEGETLESEVSSDLAEAYDDIYRELESEGLATWSSTADIPKQYSISVAMLVAEARAVKYKVPVERYQQIKFEAAEGLKKIRRLQARGMMGQTKIENF